MPTLILLRHAKSDYPPGVRDHDRPLSARGQANAATIAAHLGGFVPRGASVGAAVSTAVRAQETWQHAEAGYEQPQQHWDDAALYLAEPEVIVETTRCFTTDIGIIVGHNPGLAELAASVTPGDGVVARQLATKFPTATFAVLELADQSWEGWSTAVCTDVVICR